MDSTPKKILIINGSIRGEEGNSWTLARQAANYLQSRSPLSAGILTLTDPMPPVGKVYELLQEQDGFLVITGVYWSNWSSALQRFIEVATSFEHSPAFWGKPMACAVTMDSVGGTEVAARLHQVFSGLGCWSPPCSTLILSRVGQEAILASKGKPDDPNEDVWRLDDLEIVLKNLVMATTLKGQTWTPWPFVGLKLKEQAWPGTGPMDMGTPRFL